MLLDIICIISYICSGIQLLPCMYRLWRRKSSEDFSLVTETINITGNLCWTIYVYCSHQSPVVMLGTTVDMLTIAIFVFLVFRYHKPRQHSE